jgi:1-deoxyxylulose-5-phosphate synthase
MSELSRRDFMKRTAGTMAAGFAVAATDASAYASPAAATVRTVGKTGLKCSLLGMGTGMHGWKGQSDLTRKGRDFFMTVLKHAYSRGITYYDLADQYGSHDYVREALDTFMDRDKVMILTKSWTRDPDELRADIERFRKEIGVDQLDIVLLHCLRGEDGPNWPDKLRACMDVLSEAQEKGVLKAKGCSCHSLDRLKEAVDSSWVDVILARINPFGVKMDGPPEAVLPLLKKAHASGKGVLGMKIVGEGELKDKIPESMRYALQSGCVDAMPIGFLDVSEIDSAIAHLDAAAIATAAASSA